MKLSRVTHGSGVAWNFCSVKGGKELELHELCVGNFRTAVLPKMVRSQAPPNFHDVGVPPDVSQVSTVLSDVHLCLDSMIH